MSRRRLIDERDEGGNTALMRAALNGQSETVKALLLDGADVNARNHQGRTALLFAIVNLHTSTVQTLLDFGADVNVQATTCGCTPLLLAAGSGDIGITRALLTRGADPETICGPGRTALVVASERGYSDIVELFKRPHGPGSAGKADKPSAELAQLHGSSVPQRGTKQIAAKYANSLSLSVDQKSLTDIPSGNKMRAIHDM